MRTITKQQLINTVQANLNTSPQIAFGAVETIFKLMGHELTQGNQICVRGFGTIKPVLRKAKKARNIQKNEAMLIPAHTTVKIVPSNDLVKRINAKSYQAIH